MNYYLLFFAAKESFAQRQLVLVLLPFPSPPPYWEGLGVGFLTPGRHDPSPPRAQPWQ